jgi:hypothetical protein
MLKPSTTAFPQTVMRYTTRLICIGSLVWFGAVVANACSALQSDVALQEPTRNSGTAKSSLGANLILANGAWSFDGSSLTTQRITCDEAQLAIELKAANSWSAEDNSLRYNASELVQLAKDNGATRTTCLAGSMWSIDSPLQRVRLVTTRSDNVLVGAIVASRTDSNWEVLTVAAKAFSSHEHLLPMSSNCQTQCTRRGRDGWVQMEIISTCLSGKQLLAIWKNDDWQIRHTGWGSADSFSYLCVRGTETIYAWSDSTEGRRTVMLSRSNLAGPTANLAATKSGLKR